MRRGRGSEAPQPTSAGMGTSMTVAMSFVLAELKVGGDMAPGVMGAQGTDPTAINRK